MSKLLSVHHNACIAFGIINIYYKSSTHTYQLHHGPTKIYSIFFHLINIILQHSGTYIYWQINLNCETLGPLAIINCFLLLTNYALFSLVIVQSWWNRQDLWKILNKFKNLLKYYLSPWSISSNHDIVLHSRNLLLRKYLSACCEIIVLYLHVFSRIKAAKCKLININLYMTSIIYFVSSSISIILVDINIYMGLLFIYMSVQMLLQRLQHIARDIKLMHHLQSWTSFRNLYIHTKWRQKLQQEILLIARDERKLKILAEHIFKIFQLQLFLLLASYFLSLVSLMFFTINYIFHFDFKEFDILIFRLFVVFANIMNVVIFYNICDLLQNSFKKMAKLIYEIGIYASMGKKEIFRRDELVLRLEFLLLQIQYRELNLNVCGFFEINNKSCFSMLSSLILNLMYLIQSVFKQL
ncbi:uncharacterized protein ACRADG_001976 [Cochliomyia hominivorax]